MKNTYLKQAKLALIAIMTVNTSGVLAWNVTIKNRAGDELKGIVEQAGACQNDERIIPNGGEVTIGTGVGGTCCADMIVVRGTSGVILGKEARANPPGTGFGISCRDSSFTVKKTANNDLVIEQG